MGQRTIAPHGTPAGAPACPRQRSGVGPERVALARMDVARGGASPAGLCATPAMRVLMLLALIGASAAQMGAKRTEITVMGRLPREHANGRFTESGAIQIQQRASFQQSIAGADARIGALTRGEQRLGTRLHAGFQVFSGGGHRES
jgi:hypothetical protein